MDVRPLFSRKTELLTNYIPLVCFLMILECVFQSKGEKQEREQGG